MINGVTNLLVNLDVPDLVAAEQFYSAAFGLTAGRRFGEAAIEMLGAAAPLYLLVKPAGSTPAPGVGATRTYERHWTPMHLDFVVEDVDVAVTRAVAAGARLESPVATQRWGRLAVMSDPFGHGFCLVQFLGRGYDEIATRPQRIGP